MKYEVIKKSLHLLQFFFTECCLDPFFFKICSQKGVQAHVNVGYPNQCETTYHVTHPVCHQQVKIGKHNKKYCYVMTETIFAGEEIEEFPGKDMLRLLTSFYTVLMRFPEDLLMSNCPCYTCDWQR